MKTETFGLKIPITQDAHDYAKEFAAEQRSQEKKAKVYLNTLAVCAVRNFLNIVQIETDVELSSAWNPIERAFFDIADLYIPHLETSVECRPVLPDQEEITLPTEVTGDRIGYVFVKFDNDLQEAELLGFLSVLGPYDDFEDIDLKELEPLETLFTVLEKMEEADRVYKDPVVAKVEEQLKTQAFQEIILQYEKIWRTEPEFKHRQKVKAVLVSHRHDRAFAGATRSEKAVNNLSPEELENLEDLAEKLLDKLAEFWAEE